MALEEAFDIEIMDEDGNGTTRTSWWKADLGEHSLAAIEALGGRAPSDREALQEREADAFEELHPDR